MTQTHDTTIISIVNLVCCGLDVHKESISACLLIVDENGKEQAVIREFRTFTDDLIALRDWLIENNCPIVAIESTGIYWRPVHNILEDYLKVILVNARKVKRLPGRKTDIEDCKWLAGLLKFGLLKSSFIPPKKVRQWRDLARLRKSCVRARDDFKRRVQKTFETANIKIDSVVSDLFGKTGRELIHLLCTKEGEITLEDIEKCAHGSLKDKTTELYRSIKGFFEETHRFQIKTLMETIVHHEAQINAITQEMSKLMSGQENLLEHLDDVPGINTISGQSVISHLGTTLEDFSTENELSSWCGVSPGNNTSAGKRKSGKSHVKKHPFKEVMVEIAWAAVKKKGSFYRGTYYRLKGRIGSKKAIVAVAHRILNAVFRIIKYGETYKELGEHYVANRNKAATLSRIKKQAHKLGFVLVPC